MGTPKTNINSNMAAIGLYYFDNFIKKYTDKTKEQVTKVPERYKKFAEAYYKVYNETKEYFAKCYEITQAKIDTAYSEMAEAMRELYSKGST